MWALFSEILQVQTDSWHGSRRGAQSQLPVAFWHCDDSAYEVLSEEIPRPKVDQLPQAPYDLYGALGTL
jgi:hypothetical protein